MRVIKCILYLHFSFSTFFKIIKYEIHNSERQIDDNMTNKPYCQHIYVLDT